MRYQCHICCAMVQLLHNIVDALPSLALGIKTLTKPVFVRHTRATYRFRHPTPAHTSSHQTPT